MSINVTVTGNPVSIKRGKMVTTDPSYAKNEFERRRLMRLEQVRQQSKDIAEGVRNKVRKEKCKQMKQIEEEGREKLKSWQNRKLLELQTQYKDALQQVGLGHKEAEHWKDEEEIQTKEQEIDQQISQQRGREAAMRLQVEKNQQNLKKSIHMQRKRLTRDVENSRAALVSHISKAKPKAREQTGKKNNLSTDINITVPQIDIESEASQSPLEVSHNLTSSDDVKESTSSCECIRDSKKSEADLSNLHGELDSKLFQSSSRSKSPVKKVQPSNHTKKLYAQHSSESFVSEPETQNLTTKYHVPPSISQSTRTHSPPLDTRISDRIKQRTLMASQPDYCDIVTEAEPQLTRQPHFQSKFRQDAILSDVISNDDKNKRCGACGQNLVAGEPQKPSQKGQKCNGVSCTCNKDKENVPIRQYDASECLCRIHTCLCACLAQASTEQNTKCFVENKQSFQCPCGIHKICPCNTHIPIASESTASADERFYSGIDKKMDNASAQKQVPSKPPVRLKQGVTELHKPSHISKASVFSKETSKVQFYDHSNKFSIEKSIPSSSYVERVPPDSLEVIPDMVSEREWRDKMKQRDKEALTRGKKALEQEKIKRDYEDMLKKLPLLQKKERIAEIHKDKPEYHMSEERLKELERKRQNGLENAYNKLFPNMKPAIVTLPNKNQRSKEVEMDEVSVQSLDFAKWSVDFTEQPKKETNKFSVQEVQSIVKAFTNKNPTDRRAKLNDLLKSLNLQKEELIKEIESLPTDDSINKLIKDLRTVDGSDTQQIIESKRKKGKSERKRRRLEHDKEVVVDSYNESSSSSGSFCERKQHGKSKSRKRSRPKVIILQNTSTQTTPKVPSDIDKATKFNTLIENELPKKHVKLPGGICAKLHIPCDCDITDSNLPREELCQIFIKLDDKKQPEVVVKSKATTSSEGIPKQSASKVELKSVGIGTENLEDKEVPSSGGSPMKKLTKMSQEKVRETTEESKKKQKSDSARELSGKYHTKKTSSNKSWKEQLSKNSISTSSTSYMSPPDFQKLKSFSTFSDPSKLSFYNLHRKPQQKNLHGLSVDSTLISQIQHAETGINPKLIPYIEKLLGMSKVSVENLNVSSASSVPTPSQSVIEVESNNPNALLHGLANYLNLEAADLAKQLTYSSEHSPVHCNSSASSSEVSLSSQHRAESRNQISKECGDLYSKSKECLLEQYTDVTDSCSKRIANLAAMIKQIRKEKNEMLQNPPVSEDMKIESPVVSDKDFSTAYMDLPDRDTGSSKNSASSSFDEEEIFKKLTDIDFSLAKKLRDVPAQASSVAKKTKKQDALDLAKQVADPDSSNQEFLTRLERLMQRDIAPKTKKLEKSKEPVFVPFLSDIPKLPKFEPEPTTENSASNSNHKRPPPSKGLSVAKKFNGDISLVPHELSTIAEADSVLSTRFASGQPSPNGSKISFSSSPMKDVEQLVLPDLEERTNIDGASKVPETEPVTKQKASVPNSKSRSGEQQKLDNTSKAEWKAPEKELTEPSNSQLSGPSNDSNELSICNSACSNYKNGTKVSTSSEDVETMEAMLRSIGMEWAIPTLHKTKEALALTSSSSSSDLSIQKRFRGNESSVGEINLTEYLKKQLLDRISSSTLISGSSPSSLLGEFSDMSAIQGEKGPQRTSTPITSSKSTDKSKDSCKRVVFSDDSDISSVKRDSEHHSCNK